VTARDRFRFEVTPTVPGFENGDDKNVVRGSKMALII
jgi:hypothetical protein